jgi:predicted ATPase
MASDHVELTLGAEIAPRGAIDYKLQYRLTLGMTPKTGEVTARDEYLAKLRATGTILGRPRIEADEVSEKLAVRKSQETGRPHYEERYANHTVISIPSITGRLFPEIDQLREEFRSWRIYSLEPRAAMRAAIPPAVVDDVGVAGENLPALLFMLRNSDAHRRTFDQIVRAVRQIIPTIDALEVTLNEQRGELDLTVRQNGVSYSNRVISEGTLRVIALAAIALNPRPIGLVGLEEPENGVHPKRIESIIALLRYLALDRPDPVQVIVNTHSPLVVAQALRLKLERPGDVGVFSARHDGSATTITPVADLTPLFEDKGIDELLRSDDDAKVQALLLRGLLDG